MKDSPTIRILDKHERTVTFLKNDGNACPFYDELLTEILKPAYMTYEFKVPMSHLDSDYITESGAVVIQNEFGDLLLFDIAILEEINESGKRYKYIRGEYGWAELNGTIIRPQPFTNITAEQGLTNATSGTRWEVGRVEWFETIDLDYTSHTSALGMLHDIESEYGGELVFRVEVNKFGVVSGRYVDLVKKRGVDSGQRFTVSKDLKGVKRIHDRTTVATSLIGIGKGDDSGNPIDFTGIEWSVANGDPVDKPIGQDWVGDEQARHRWSGTKKHIEKPFTYDTSSPQVLLQKTWEELQRIKNGILTYEADVELLEKKVRLGDTVLVQDLYFRPELMVSARIHKKETSRTNKSANKVYLGDYQEARSNGKMLKELSAKLRQYEVVWSQGEKIIKAPTAPAYPKDGQLWIQTFEDETAVEVWWRWDESLTSWIKVTPTTAEEVGTYDGDTIDQKDIPGNKAKDKIDTDVGAGTIETTQGAQSKADEAEQSAISEAQQRINDAKIILDKNIADANIRIDTAQTNIANAETTLSNLQINLGQTESDLTAAQTDIASAYTDISNLQTSLDSVNTELSNKIDESVYSAKVSEINADIAEKVDGAFVNGRLQVAIDDIEIGGRNLLRNSNDTVPISTASGITYAKVTDEGYSKVLKLSNPNLSSYVKMNDSLVSEYPNPNEDFTVSFLVKGTAGEGKQPILELYYNGSTGYLPLETTVSSSGYVKVFRTFNTSDTDPNMHIGISNFSELFIAKVKVEKGNKATDWTPAPEDYYAEIAKKADGSTVYTISEIDGKFDNVVSVTEYTVDQEGYVERFESNESRLYQNEEAIGAKVDQTIYDSLANTVSNHSATLNVQADEISSKVDATYVNGAIDDIEIGGRNLLEGSDTEEYSKSIDETYGTYNQFWRSDITHVDKKINIGDTITVSFDVQMERGDVLRVYDSNNSGEKALGSFTWSSIGVAKQRLSFTTIVFQGESRTIHHLDFYNTDNGDRFTIENIKIEKGNKPTSWTPAPEDIDQRVTTAESSITQLADEIDLKVNANGIITAINLSPEGVRIQGKEITLDGDTLITGTLGAGQATFVDMTTQNMTAIDALMQDATVTGNLNATNATFLNGSFDSAEMLYMTAVYGTIIQATMQDVTIEGNIVATDATFLNATIQDAIIQDAVITGDLIGGSITSNTDINVTTDLRVGNNIYLGEFGDLSEKKIIFDSNSDISHSTLSGFEFNTFALSMFDFYGDVQLIKRSEGPSLEFSNYPDESRIYQDNTDRARLKMEAGSAGIWVDPISQTTYIVAGGSAKHSFYSDGGKAGGSIVIDGETLGMSPIDSPRVLISDMITDIKLTANVEHEIRLNETFAKAISSLSVFPSLPVTIRKGKDKFYVIASQDCTVDFMLYGNRIGYESTYFMDMAI